MKNSFNFSFLGTGHGMATECFNTCFTISKNNNYFLIDSGGGNGILSQLKKMKIDLKDIKVIFISHSHLDHILGIIWIIRVLAKKYYKKEINDPVYIYGNDVVIKVIYQLIESFLPNDFMDIINKKIIIEEVKNNDEKIILGKKIKFFDLYAKKIKQYGFAFEYEKDKKIVFIGDEVFSFKCRDYLDKCEYLLAGAYMCGEEAEIYDPIKKHCHSTVKYISEVSEKLMVKNLILLHTIDNDLTNRKEKFIKDSKLYYNGRVFVPSDLEIIKIE